MRMLYKTLQSLQELCSTIYLVQFPTNFYWIEILTEMFRYPK